MSTQSIPEARVAAGVRSVTDLKEVDVEASKGCAPQAVPGVGLGPLNAVLGAGAGPTAGRWQMAAASRQAAGVRSYSAARFGSCRTRITGGSPG